MPQELRFKNQGFKPKLTKTSGDFGVDVVVINSDGSGEALVQCKLKRSGKVNPDAVREVFTARSYYEGQFKTRFPKLYVTTNTECTPETQILAKTNSVTIWDRNVLAKKLSEIPVTMSEIFSEKLPNIN